MCGLLRHDPAAAAAAAAVGAAAAAAAAAAGCYCIRGAVHDVRTGSKHEKQRIQWIKSDFRSIIECNIVGIISDGQGKFPKENFEY